jgi:hypothetical protein
VGQSDWELIVPGGELWHVLSVRALFSTDATAGNRAPALQFWNAERFAWWSSPLPVAIPPNTAGCEVSWGVGVAPAGPMPQVQSASLLHPSIPLFPGEELAVATRGLGNGDRWTWVRLYLRVVIYRGIGAELRRELERERELEELRAQAAYPVRG